MSMKNSGHSEYFRCTVMNKAVERYKKELLKHQEGKEIEVEKLEMQREVEKQTKRHGLESVTAKIKRSRVF